MGQLALGNEHPAVSCTQCKSGWPRLTFPSWLLSSMGRLRTTAFSLSLPHHRDLDRTNRSVCVNFKLRYTIICYQSSWPQHCCPHASLSLPVRAVEPGLPKGKQRRNKPVKGPASQSAISTVRERRGLGCECCPWFSSPDFQVSK